MIYACVPSASILLVLACGFRQRRNSSGFRRSDQDHHGNLSKEHALRFLAEVQVLGPNIAMADNSDWGIAFGRSVFTDAPTRVTVFTVWASISKMTRVFCYLIQTTSWFGLRMKTVASKLWSRSNDQETDCLASRRVGHKRPQALESMPRFCVRR